MVITRTPFRVSFFGGGTDYPVYFRAHGGAVLSTTIDKYCDIIARKLSPVFPYNYGIRYTAMEEAHHLSEIRHPSARECLAYAGFTNERVAIQHSADLPAMAGLGASSAFTVGLLHALYALKGAVVDKKKLACDAIHVEQERIRESVGSQDQTAAAFGGFNRIDFHPGGDIIVTPLAISDRTKQALEARLLMLYTGGTRIASEVAAEQIKSTPQKERELSLMKNMVNDAAQILAAGEGRLDDFGRLLHETWLLKRSLTQKITTSTIDELYERARNAGALGGKLLGAGGGGFLLLFIRPETEAKIREAFSSMPLIPCRFENEGSRILYQQI